MNIVKRHWQNFMNGMKLGMLLQIAIGPICVLVFQLSLLKGFMAGFIGTVAVFCSDALFVFLAIIGMGKLIEKHPKLNQIVNFFGNIALIIFGALFIFYSFQAEANSYSISFTEITYKDIFITVFLLTLANPLTVIFWTGIFARRVKNYSKLHDNYIFGLGASSATLVFLSVISLFGQISSDFLPPLIISGLNFIVGGLLIFFAVKSLVKTTKKYLLLL